MEPSSKCIEVNMQVKLQALRGKRAGYTAIFCGYGTYSKKGIVRGAIRLRDLRDASGKLLTTHAWVDHTVGFDAIGRLQKGDIVEFTSKIDEYLQIYRGQAVLDLLTRTPNIGCRLESVRNIRKIGNIATFRSSLKKWGGRLIRLLIFLQYPDEYHHKKLAVLTREVTTCIPTRIPNFKAALV